MQPADSNVLLPHDACVGFSVENYRSIARPGALSLRAHKNLDAAVSRQILMLGWESAKPALVLPVCGGFGANATGKSSLLKAAADMRAFVLLSFRDDIKTESLIPFRPSFLTVDGSERATRYAIELIVNCKRWRYSFAVNGERVVAEKASFWPHGREVRLFRREGDVVQWGTSLRKVGPMLERLVRDGSSLLLSAAAAIERTSLTELHDWFVKNLTFCHSNNLDERIAYTAGLIGSSSWHSALRSLLRAADLGIEDVRRHCQDKTARRRIRLGTAAMTCSTLPRRDAAESNGEDLLRLRHGASWDGQTLHFSDESSGTQALVGLAGIAAHALHSGTTLLVDELDAGLHPRITEMLLHLFQKSATNPQCAQLVFTAHDTNLLDATPTEGLRLTANQIWLAERDSDGAASFSAPATLSPGSREHLRGRHVEGHWRAVPRRLVAATELARQ